MESICLFRWLNYILGVICVVNLAGCQPSVTNRSLEKTMTLHSELATPTHVLPTRQPRPAYLIDVFPGDRSSIPLSIFAAKSENDSERCPSIGEVLHPSNRQIYLKLDARLIAQPGDNLLAKEILERITLTIDNEQQNSTTLVNFADLNLYIVEFENQPVAYIPSPATICWETYLQPGLHQATFQIEQTSGNVLFYDWWFTLIQD